VFYWCLPDAEVAENIALMREANTAMLENIANAQAEAAEEKAAREEAARRDLRLEHKRRARQKTGRVDRWIHTHTHTHTG
jgi:hypothetical protein